MPPKFDDSAYQEGHKLFRKRRTLRSILEPLVERADNGDDGRPFKKPSNDAEYRANDEWSKAKESRDFSRVVGFVDGFLDHIRGRS